ncbi:odorant receptor 82a [Diachasma alloeum]|uniref:Odorant receptor n=1 Tax=Diachasma alloeum TaxID=454923 RepID=A0A4E0RYZ0_9HYME|nr:odorant receptor 82a [Diachasma alloeum]THK33041.1 odorant receptor 15 [Diachasma alloeum]
MSVRAEKTVEEIKSIQFTKWLLTPLGVWPFVKRHSTLTEIRLGILLQLFCHSLLAFVVVPSVFHIFARENDLNVRIALFGPVGFVVMNLLKYCAIIYHRGGIGRCIRYIESDWRGTQDQDHRDIMMKNASTGRNLTILCATFMYSGGMLYHTLMPFLLTTPIAADKNSSNRPIVYPGYDAVFDPYVSPTYEIIFLSHCLAAMIIYTITTVSCNLAASFVSHACGQIQILVARLDHLVDDGRGRSEKYLKRKIGDIIRYHAGVLRFTVDIEEILREICLVEVVASTLIICLLEYYCMTTWSESETIGICTYFILLISLSFNIFIFCYIGELLKEQFGDVGTSTYLTEWYRLPPNCGLMLILIIATAQAPRKITAGGLIDLSLNSFVGVIKTSLMYLNLLRTVET